MSLKCPQCVEEDLKAKRSNYGSVIDQCESCSGIWLDRGEIFLFSKDPHVFAQHLSRKFEILQASNRRCPHCDDTMDTYRLIVEDLEVEACANCRGIWLDGGEMERLQELDEALVKMGE